jgi:CRP/FNR family transcriptional regulator
MENKKSSIRDLLKNLDKALVDEMLSYSIIKTIPENTEILREGQYVKVIPIVITGLIKVFTRYDDRELLLYYIKPKESCIMSFAANLENKPSKVFACTEEETTALLLPINKITKWIKQYPDMNNLFFKQYSIRYIELLETIHHVLFNKMDSRLYSHLLEKVHLTQKNPIKISHKQIADELGTVREVISRVMKKLEKENKVKQHLNSIEIF